MRDVGIDDDFIKDARDQITPGTSALFLMSSDAVLDKVRETFRRTGLRAKLIHTDLTDDQEAAIHELFGSRLLPRMRLHRFAKSRACSQSSSRRSWVPGRTW